MKKTEYQLIEKCKQNDTAAKEWLYKTYAPTMLGVCLRYIKNRMQAEDVLQESFITVFEKIHQLKSNDAFEGWMKRIVVNNALQFLKAQEHHKDVDDLNNRLKEEESDNDPKDIKEQILQLEITQEQMLAVINEMPVGFRTVFNLYVFEKLKHSEIAAQLNISEGTSKSQLLRARKHLQKNMLAMVQEKQKSRKREKVYLASFMLVMNDDLSYIDKLAQSRLEGFSVPPITGTEFIAQAAAVNSTSTVAGVKAKIISVIGKKAVWLSSTVVATAGLATMLVTNQPVPVIPIEHEAPVIEFTESVNDLVPALPIGTVRVVRRKKVVAVKQINKTIEQHVEVPVKVEQEPENK